MKTADKKRHFQWVIARIEEDITNGTIALGERINERQMAERYGVSRTPIREAILCLAWSGVLEIHPRKGATVAKAGIPQLISLAETIADMESLCAAYSARRMSKEERDNLKNIFEKSANAVNNMDLDEYYRFNKEFHEAIYAGSHNDTLAHAIRSLNVRLSLYRRAMLDMPGRLKESQKEHQAICDAIVNGDPDSARTNMLHHLNVHRREFLDMLSKM